MIIGVNCGHTADGPGYGAVGIIKESEHTRLVGQALMDLLRSAGAGVVDCTVDKAGTQQEYLAAVVAFANRQDLDWFISIHFNASKTHMGNGTEIYTYKGRQYPDALEVCAELAKLGFKNRGVKEGTGLYVIHKTKAKSMLIECCFCDSHQDVGIYNAAGGAPEIAEAVFKGICKHIMVPDTDGGTSIMGESLASACQLNALLLSGNPQAENYLHLAEIFLEEGEKEGVRGDGAFCQSLVETGWFRFGGDVHPGQHNYAGLGAVGGVPGLSFPDERTGIRAQIQHLKGYASVEPLAQACADPRYRYISRGCAPVFEQLSGKWAVPGYTGYKSLEEARAAGDSYGDHIVKLMGQALQMQTASCQPQPDETAPEGMLFVVQVGAYKSMGRARKLQERLEKMGVISMIKEYPGTGLQA